MAKEPHDPKLLKAPKPAKPSKDTVDGARLWLLLLKAFHAINGYAAPSMRAEGLADSDFRVMESLLHKGALPVNVIGAKVFLTTGSISTAVERLYTRGLVTRTDSAADRRQRLVDLTPKGRKLIERAYATHAAALNKLAEALEPSERRRLAVALKTLGKAAATAAEPVK